MAFMSFHPICRTLCVLVCILHVRELRRTTWFGKVGGGKTIVLRTRVVAIQAKVNATSGLAGRGGNVDVGKILLEKKCSQK